MRTIVLSIAILSLTNMNVVSQGNATPIKSVIKNVTVFLSGAEIQREGSVTLRAGAQKLLFENLPSNINPHSIQVSGVGNFTILSVSHHTNYLKNADKSTEAENMEQAMKTAEAQLKLQKATLDNYIAEENMLHKNRSIGGSQTGVKTAELKEFADYYRTRLSELTARKLDLSAKIENTTKEVERLKRQLETLHAESQRPTSVITVEVTAPTSMTAKLSASYLAYGASWEPTYDLRVTDVNYPVELTYKANVHQTTGEDWNNIMPVFSTAEPMVDNTKPELNPWYLSFYQPAPVSEYQLNADAYKLRYRARPASAEKADAILENDMVVATTPMSIVLENQTSVEFIVDVPYTIASDGQWHAVELTKSSLQAEYDYYAVRKLEKDVFLLAKITDWERLNLLPGKANVFFEGRYVGSSQINTRHTENNLAISLGRDKNITVTRIRKKDFSEKQFLGNNVTETREWDLTVHNKKSQPITITIEDQVPVSTDKEIKVDVQNMSEAVYNADKGLLTWRLTLPPSQSKSMNVKYAVKYPKGKTVMLE